MHGLEPSKEFGCAPFFEAGAIGDMLRPFEAKLTSFGVSGEAQLLPHDRTNGGQI